MFAETNPDRRRNIIIAVAAVLFLACCCCSSLGLLWFSGDQIMQYFGTF
jgi:hypothetical protein